MSILNAESSATGISEPSATGQPEADVDAEAEKQQQEYLLWQKNYQQKEQKYLEK